MAEPQYVVIAGFPNADFMAVALDKDGVAISEKTFKPIDCKKIAVRAAFLFLSSQDVLKAVPWMGLIWRALANCVACCRRGRSDAVF